MEMDNKTIQISKAYDARSGLRIVDSDDITISIEIVYPRGKVAERMIIYKSEIKGLIKALNLVK